MKITFLKSESVCSSCAQELKSANVLNINNFSLTFCEQCLVDLREEILQECRTTENKS